MSNHNPAAAFFASPVARGISALLRGLDRLAPRYSTQLALRLFLTPVPTKRAARAREVPAPWRVERLPFEGASIAVWQRSDVPADAPRVLLVHGWAGDAQQMRGLGDALVRAGRHPVLIDLPAHGRSDGWSSNLAQWVRALFAVTARFGPWDAIGAHSLGSIAVAHALARGLPCRRVALIAAAPPPTLFLRWFAAAIGLGDGLAERMVRLIERRERVVMAEFEPAWIGTHLSQPTLLVHDRGDRTAPLAGSEALARVLPRSRLRTTDGLGHRRVLDDAAVVTEVAAHLAGTEPVAANEPG